MITHSTLGLRLLRPIGEGACGRVYEGVREGGHPCAVKQFDPQAINHAYLAYCIEKLRVLPHPRLAPVLEFHPDDVQGPPLHAMPLYADPTPSRRGLIGRTLEAHCGHADAEACWHWISQMADALAFLHLHAVVHCNFKPSNVFLDHAGEAVVTDYGQGWIGGVEALPLNDHVFYAPPEQLRHPTQIQFGIGERWDVYAFGVTAFKLLTGHFPRGDAYASHWRNPEIHGELPEPVLFADVAENEPSPAWPGPPASADEAGRRQIIEQCLAPDPAQRWVDMREVRDALAAADRAQAERTASAQIEQEFRHLQALATGDGRPLTAEERRLHMSGGKDRLVLGWGLAAAVAACGALGVLYYLEHTQLAGSREMVARQQDSLRELAGEKDTGFASRDQALAEARAALQTALDSEKRALANLGGTQRAADQFFGNFLEAAAQLPADAERSRLLLAGYDYFSKFVAQNTARPEMAESCLRARCHLAEIKLALGGTAEAADKFEEARALISEFLTQNPSHSEARAFQLRAADCALSVVRLRLANGQAGEAAFASLGSALATLNELARQENASPELQRRLAEGEMVMAKARLTQVGGDLQDAQARLQRATDALNYLLGDPSLSQADDKILLGRASLLRGQLLRQEKKIEPALSAQVETAHILLECGDRPEALDLLAQCYGETGEMLSANSEAKDAARAHGEAVKLLTDLVKSYPDRTDLRFQLATRYADLAQILRDNTQAPRALDYQRGAVELVRGLLDRETSNAVFATALARMRADLSDLLATLGQKNDALAQAREAISLLDKLNLPGAPSSTTDLAQRVSIAKSYGLVGHVAEDAKQLAEAQACFSKAVVHYESAAAVQPSDDAIDRGLTWTRMRLAKLKP